MSPSEIYTKLSQDEIRILTIQPSSFSTRIHGQLEMFSLDEVPSYIAVSYTWGDAAITEQISINNLAFQVTTNLAAALKRFQHPTERILLWADAICINQTDLLERGHQVALMQRVFSQAEETWIWLGEEAEDSNKAIDIFELLADVYEDCLARSKPPSNWSRKDVDCNVWGSPFSWNTNDELIALEYLFARDWWVRIWIVQEVAVSRNPSLFCGSRKISWRTVISACRLLYPHIEEVIDIVTTESQSHPPPARGIEFSIDRVLSIHHALMSCHRSGQSRQHFLLALLSRHQNAKATDPRDKFLGLLGLVPARYLTFPMEQIYEMSLNNVFKMAAVLIATHEPEGPLNFLDYAGSDKRALPSWVPRWDVSSRNSNHFLYNNVHHSESNETPCDSACGKYPSSYSPVLDPAHDKDSLIAMGIVVDRVELVSFDPFDPGNTRDWSRPENAPEAKIYKTMDAVNESFWNTLVAGRERPGNKPIPLNDYGLFAEVFYNSEHYFGSSVGDRELLQWYNKNKHIRFRGTSFEEIVQDRHQYSLPYHRKAVESIKNTIRDKLYHRSLAITRNGYSASPATRCGPATYL